MGNTTTFVYAEDPDYRPSEEALRTLEAEGNLTTLLGFRGWSVNFPEVELRLTPDMYYGEGMDDREPIERPFAIVIREGFRVTELDNGETLIRYDVPEDIMARLEKILGTKLRQDMYLG